MSEIENEPTVDETKLDNFTIRVKDFCLTNGLIFLDNSNDSNLKHDLACPVPVTLVPTKFPRSEFHFAYELQRHFHHLIHLISSDFLFLRKTLENVIKVDDFTRRLWDICVKVNHEGISQPISLAIIRNDYMLDRNKAANPLTSLTQIEINTISCSFGAATSKVAQLHKNSLNFTNNQKYLDQLPPNENVTGLATGLVKTWQLYGNTNSKLVFLVDESERNIGDQRLLEYKCLELLPTLDIKRYTLSDVVKSGKLDQNKNLFIDENEIGLVYFRTCYDPNQIKNDQEWDARLLIERSRAIKCPNIQVHLTGAKIIQQALSEPNVLDKFINDTDILNRIKATFVDIYSINSENIEKIIALINEKADEFVLKPQREGGGNNIYKQDIRNFIEKLNDKSELTGYILMKLVDSYLSQNYVIKSAAPVKKQQLMSELGIFGYYIYNGETEIANETCGYLLRSKPFGINEGGVATGFSALDSIFLN